MLATVLALNWWNDIYDILISYRKQNVWLEKHEDNIFVMAMSPKSWCGLLAAVSAVLVLQIRSVKAGTTNSTASGCG